MRQKIPTFWLTKCLYLPLMSGTRIYSGVIACFGGLVLVFLLWSCGTEPVIGFNDEIRPILNEKCVGCHGGVKQAGGFGLVFRENALRETDSGKFAIIPGDAAGSELVRRIKHTDPELRMPLDAEPLTEAEINLLESWIDQGAQWEEHWAYQLPVLPELPAANEWSDQPIDRFVYASLVQENLAPSGRAPKYQLLRRVSFDLTGLPPDSTLVQNFLNDDSPAAYGRLVDTLLSRPAYGEHWASYWLDLARYADSRGYERDRPRTIWPYRDWVIRAFNRDLPFDEFTLEQLAGDLLEQPTKDQFIATGFHRNTLSNGEGGTENEEYRTVSVMDRVSTTYEVWQATTMACVQCHSHPYDPIKHDSFYRSYALFNNTVDHDHVSESPGLVTLFREDERKYRRLQDWLSSEPAAEREYWRRWLKLREPRLRAYDLADHNGVFTGRADEDYLFLRPGEYFRLPARSLDDVGALVIDHSRFRPGSMTFRLEDENGPEIETFSWGKSSWNIRTRLDVEGITGEHAIYVSVEGKEPEAVVVRLYTVGYEKVVPGTEREGYEEIKAFVRDLSLAKDSIRTPVMVENPPELTRTTYRFERGNWLVHGPEMDGGPHEDRLAFARWMVSGQNPLTARVAVNRFWAQLFGRGLVPTVADFGTQGERPSHPELLDYLAVRFSGELNWSIKGLLREIVLSETYQQSTGVAEKLRERDPLNSLLARGPRKRLTGEQLRDQALAVSGALSRKMYGPGVMPPQPEGFWDGIVYSNLKWETSEGEDRYRRAVYTFLRRSAIYPGMSTFDGSDREFCLSERTPTNTPLQALMTLNDPAFRELAAMLADKVLDEPTQTYQLNTLFRRVLFRTPSSDEVEVLKELHRKAFDHYQAAGTAQPEKEAMAVVVNAVFNLDESLNLN